MHSRRLAFAPYEVYLMFLTPLAFNHNHNVDYAYLRCVLYCYDFFAPFHALLFMLDWISIHGFALSYIFGQILLFYSFLSQSMDLHCLIYLVKYSSFFIFIFDFNSPSWSSILILIPVSLIPPWYCTSLACQCCSVLGVVFGVMLGVSLGAVHGVVLGLACQCQMVHCDA